MGTTHKFYPKSSLYALAFGVGTWCLYLLAHAFPAFVEQWYSRGFFLGVRVCMDATFAHLPVPPFYVFWAGVVVYWILTVWRRPAISGLRRRLGYWLLKIAGFAAFLLGAFFWLWGFNYARVPVPQQLGLEMAALDSTFLWQELRSETRLITGLRQQLAGQDTLPLNDERLWPRCAEDTIRAAVEKWLEAANFPSTGRVRAMMIRPEGTLFKFGTLGIYWPFVGTGNIESGMHPLRKLPTIAHEMSHGYGFTDEGICNFIAYVACADHPNTYIAYSTHLEYWRCLASACRKSDPERYDREFRPFIPAGIRQDERAIRRQHARFSELAPAMRYQVYDAYLKSNGVQAGMMSYDELLDLVVAWKRKTTQ